MPPSLAIGYRPLVIADWLLAIPLPSRSSLARVQIQSFLNPYRL